MKVSLLSTAAIVLVILLAYCPPIVRPVPVPSTSGSLKATWKQAQPVTKLVWSALAAGGVAWLGHQYLDHKAKWIQQHAKFQFVSPHAKSEYKCGDIVNIQATTFGLGSMWTYSELTLMSGNGAELHQIFQGRASHSIKADRWLRIGSPRNGNAQYTWQIPTTLASGFYRIKFDLRAYGRRVLPTLSSPFQIHCSPNNIAVNNDPTSTLAAVMQAPTLAM